MNVDRDAAVIALADYRASLTDFAEARRPDAKRTAARLDVATRDITAASPKTITVEQVQLGAREVVERELAGALVTRADAAVRASDAAHAAVDANMRGLEELPDYYPAAKHGQSDAARELGLLRAELQLRDARTELRDEESAEVIARYAEAHVTGNWLVANAAHAELERRVRVPQKAKSLGEAAALDSERVRIRQALDAARARRAAKVDPNLRAELQSHVDQLAHLDAELQKHAGLAYEVRQLQRYPLAGVGR